MKVCRTRRNEFFHSTHLLNLNIYRRDCIEAYLDLFKALYNLWRTRIKR